MSTGNTLNPGEAIAILPPGPAAEPPHTFFLKLLTYCILYPLFAVATAFFGSLALTCALWDRTGRQQHAIARIWGRTLLRITLSPVQVIGREKLRNPDGTPLPPAVYASNHLSYMDTPVLFGHLPFQFRIFAKSSLWKLPFIGWYLNRSGQVPIDQKNTRTAIAGLTRGAETLRHGMPLVLFPEGGRSETGELQDMMSGCAYMAIRARVPLVPLALIGTYELMPMHTYHVSPRPLKLVVGDPIPTDGYTARDADALTQRLYATITALFLEHSTH